QQTETEGFEPSVRTCRTQPFQGCPFSHSGTSPRNPLRRQDVAHLRRARRPPSETWPPKLNYLTKCRGDVKGRGNRPKNATKPRSRFSRTGRGLTLLPQRGVWNLVARSTVRCRADRRV